MLQKHMKFLTLLAKPLGANLKIYKYTQSTELRIHSIGEGEPSEHLSFPHYNGACTTKAIPA